MSAPGMSSSHASAHQTIRLLLVDDDEPDRRTLRWCLRRAGVSAGIDEALSGAEALRRAAPGAYSLALLREIQRADPVTPVVVLMGHGNEAVAVEFMRAGAVDYLSKASLTPERIATSFRYAQEMSRATAARRRAEEELREQETRFRTLVDAIPQLAWMADHEGSIYWYNQRWYDYTGTTIEEMRGWGWQKVHHPDHVQRVVQRIRRSFEAGEPWEDTFPLRRADGAYRWFLSRALPMRRPDGRVAGWFGTNTDITERREAEQALAASEERFRRALGIETVGVLFFTVDGRITGANDAFLRMSGYSRDEVEAGGVRRDALTPPEFALQSGRADEEFEAAGRTTPHQKQCLRKDGSRWWAVLAATRLNEREGVEFVLDITEQKQAELERERILALERAARAEAEQATKTRDDVLAILAHDLRNPMHTIVGAAAMLALTAEEERRQRQIGIIQRATRRMERLVDDLLDMARIEGGTFAVRQEPVDMRALITETLELEEPEAAARHVTLRPEVADDLLPIAADRERLQQLLANLVGNAVKFNSAGSIVSVRAANGEGGIHISVKDSGQGIPAEDLPRIFERFWQANRASSAGAGLGLAICKGIVEAHGGRIWAASKVGRGTTIHVHLPCRLEPSEAGGATPAAASATQLARPAPDSG